ncbi:MAG: CRISPR-associated endonuclease Cas1, partial [Candidatus Parvarchaeum sp.]
MNPLLISGFGTNISVDKRRLIIQNKLDNQRYEYYPHQIKHDSIILDGHTGSISFEAMRWLVKHNVHITMLNWNGNLLSVTLPKEPASANLKIRQYEAYSDSNKKRSIAEAIVKEKVRHSQNLLNELSAYYPEIKLDTLKERVIAESVLTYEGNMAVAYWNEIGKVLNKLYPEFRFTDRNGRRHSWNMNASDEVNALLNYGYAILESEIRKDINIIGLDSSIGFLHELKDGRSSLVYDLQELGRWLIDLSVIQLLEEKKLKKSDFIVTENYNIRLRENTAKALIEKIKINFNARALYNSKYYSYQNILYENVRLLANYIIGKSNKLKFNIPEFRIKREDSTDIRNKVLGLT